MRKNVLSRINKYILISLAFILLDLFSRLPYFNVVLSFWVIILILWTVSFIAFNVKSWIGYTISLFLLVIIFICIFLKRELVAEEIGNVIYYILLVGFIDEFLRYIKTIKPRNKQ